MLVQHYCYRVHIGEKALQVIKFIWFGLYLLAYSSEDERGYFTCLYEDCLRKGGGGGPIK